MNKRILVLTPIYPGKDIIKEFTPVVHYFTKEWVNEGHQVRVIHNQAYYPLFFYGLARIFTKLIASITGTNVPVRRLKYKYKYILDGIKVSRLPMYKKFPHSKFSKRVISIQAEQIITELKDFEPDFIVGHWSNPQLELLVKLKETYSESKTTLVMHDDGISLKSLYGDKVNGLFSQIDCFGFRSNPIKEGFEKNFGKQKNTFMCFSGIPEKFVVKKFHKKFGNQLSSFLFVGTLIQRKYPEKIIDALAKFNFSYKFELNYIGEGKMSRVIIKKINKHKFNDKIYLKGRISRDEVWELMLKSDCFIMISKDEAFGLVYLEAMAAGCITIASRNEGFDGVINDGVNGFLCEAGNTNELAIIIAKINELTVSEKQEISSNAMATASLHTNSRVADVYLKSLER